MHTLQSSYTRWTWIVAVLLALVLLWMLFTGRGPTAGCCGAVSVPADIATVVSPDVSEVAPASEPFSFSADALAFNSQGKSDAVTWLSKVDALKSWLANGKDWMLNGNASAVTLTGSVDTESVKQEKGAELQALLGAEVRVDNQLRVDAPAPVVEATPPKLTKLYFDTGKTELSDDSIVTLAPMVNWLKANPQAKVVVSGYHDSRGTQEKNEKLAKNRAQSALNALLAAGIAAERIEMRKPMVTEDTGNMDEARRVEVFIE